jgi:hypothetical protein
VNSGNNCTDTIPLSAQQQSFLLDELDQAAAPAEVQLRRTYRYRYAVREGIRVQLEGSATQFTVRPRNLSAGGISFLHGGAIDTNAVCSLTLRTIDGAHVLAVGRVVRCRCVHGRIHEVSVQFHRPLRIEAFVDVEDVRRVEQLAAAEEALDSSYPREEVARLADGLRALARRAAPRSAICKALRDMLQALRTDAP